jgi:KaiC/GvpD/RAD55 family RecA-like ATPase
MAEATVGVTLFDSLFNPVGETRELTWRELGKFMDSPGEFTGENHCGWSCTTFTGGHRDLSKVITANALGLDFDKTTPRQVLEALFSGATYYVHSSKRNSETVPRYRAILQLSRPVTRDEYYRVWRAYTERFLKRVDKSTKDPTRFWYRPCKTAETKWEFWGQTCAPLDVDALIDAAKKLEAADQERMAQMVRVRPEVDEVTAADRAVRYIAKMDPAISGSDGHRSTWAVACVLARGFSLSRNVALSILVSDYNPRCHPPWSMKELEHKIDEAISKTRDLPDGYLLGDRTGWTPARRAELPPCPPSDDYIPEPPPGWDDPDGIPCDDATEPEKKADVPCITVEAFPEEPPYVPTAAERYGALSEQELCLEVLTDVNKSHEPGAPTGVGDIDVAMGGIRRGMILVVGMKTSIGKTTLAMMSLDETKKRGMRPLILSFEDAPLLYGRKLVARRGKLNALAMRDRRMSATEKAKIVEIAGQASTEPIFLNCVGKSVEYACRAIVDLNKELDFDLVMVDYIQRMKTDRRLQDRRNEVTYAVATISDTIKNADCGGMLLSQLKRTNSNEEPDLEDLKESGDIECFAEHIVLGWKTVETDPDNGQQLINRWVKLAKNKDGPVITDPILLKWHAPSASFEAIESKAEIERQQMQREIDDIDNQFDTGF